MKTETLQERESLAGDRLCKIDEAANYLAISRASLYEILSRGEIASVKIGRSRRVPLRALIAFAAAHIA